MTQFEIAGVKQRIVCRFEEDLGGTENVTGRQKGKIDIANAALFAEGQDVFVARSPGMRACIKRAVRSETMISLCGAM